MVICAGMDTVALVLEKLVAHEDVVIARVNDRFGRNPTPGGWRDCQVCFFIKSDPNKHVCELQIVHKFLYAQRVTLPGHFAYERTRNAVELLDVLTKCPAAWGVEPWFMTEENVERAFLRKLFMGTKGSSWTKQAQGWAVSSEDAVGEWFGIVVHEKTRNVLQLNLPNNNLIGKPAAVFVVSTHNM